MRASVRTPAQRIARLGRHLVVFPAALLALAACADDYPPFTYGTLDVKALTLTPEAGGSVRVDADFVITLAVDGGGDDDVALDAVRLTFLDLDPMAYETENETRAEIVDVAVGEGDWPVNVEVGEPVARTAHVVARIPGPLPGSTEACGTTLSVDASVFLLDHSGRTESTAYVQVPIEGSGPRLDLPRRIADVALPATATPQGDPVATMDGAGNVWVVSHGALGYDPAGVRDDVVRLASDGALDRASPLGLVTLAALEDGVAMTTASAATVTLTRQRDAHVAQWTRTIRSQSIVEGSFVPVAAATDRIVVALPGGADVTIDDVAVDTEAPPESTVLIELDGRGEVLAATTVPMAVWQMAASGRDLFLLDDAGLALLRDGALTRWAPLLARAIAFDADGDVYAAGTGLDGIGRVTRFDGGDGTTVWSVPFDPIWQPSSVAVRENGEVLVGAPGALVARLGPGGDPLFEGPVLCGGAVSFASFAGRVAFASNAYGEERWGGGPERDGAVTPLSVGEVLP